MAIVENAADATKGATAGGIAGGAIEASTSGLSRAAEAAGDVLRGIFGGLPWNMTPSEIVDAVTGGTASNASQATGDAAGTVLPWVMDLLVVA